MRERRSSTEGLFWPSDVERLAGYWDEPSSPMQRFEMHGALVRARTGPIFRRHGLWPYHVALAEGALEKLDDEMSTSEFGVAARLTRGEFLGYVCGIWLSDKELSNRSLHPRWRRELSLIHYKIERARRSRNTKREIALRALRAQLNQKYEREIADYKEIANLIAEKVLATEH